LFSDNFWHSTVIMFHYLFHTHYFIYFCLFSI
jgi:hypothetical protein